MAWQIVLGTGCERISGITDLARTSISAIGRPAQNDLAEQDCGEPSGVFLVALVERLRDGVAQRAQAVANGVAPVVDEVEVQEQRLRSGFLEFRAFGELHSDLAEALGAVAVPGDHQ